MGDPRAAIRDALADGRPDDALVAVERLLEGGAGDVELLVLRMESLAGVGQFELAQDLARTVLAREPRNLAAAQQLAVLEAAMAPPPRGPTDPAARPYRSDLPTAMLQRLQQALHHQSYGGVQLVKNPFDLLLYQQLVFRLRPGTIIEIGSKAGGSALFLGDLLRNFGIDGRVNSYDIVPVSGIEHPLVTFARANGRRLEEALSDADVAAMARPLLVIEDADHSEQTSAAVLAFFHRHLAPGDWIILEDGNLSDIFPDLYPAYSSGPHLALQAFFREHAGDYRIASEYCDFYAYNGTAASNGFLERVPSPARRS